MALRTRADARIAGRAPLVSTCASVAHQLVCRPVCSPEESESHMRAYERPEPSRWGTLRAEKRWITCAGDGAPW